MIQRLTAKIIAVVLGTLLLVFAIVLLVLNISLYQDSVRRTESFMTHIVDNDGFFLPPRKAPGTAPNPEWRSPLSQPETMREGRFFYVKTDENGSVTEWNLDMMFDFTQEDAVSYVTAALESGRTKGTVGSFSYVSAEKPYGRILVFTERSIEMGILNQLTRTSLWVAGIAGLVLAALSVFLARWMTKPVQAAFDRQKRFISDASHELKTPLTILSANADVLEGEIGNNQRLAHIQSQAMRMSGLIHDLLTLAQTDENAPAVRHAFNASKAILETALEFECQAFEEGKNYHCQIADNLTYTGDEKQIKQLAGILIDNAIRYSGERGEIRVSLQPEGGRLCLSVFNTGEGIPGEEHHKIFERFYRSDPSRSRESGGYGVGLSIAKAITEAHKGKIGVSGEHGQWIRFDVVL